MRIHYIILLVGLLFCGKSAYSQPASNTPPEGTARKVLNINSKADDYGPYIARNGLAMYFSSNRFGKTHIYVAKRRSIDTAWGEPDYCKVSNSNQDFVNSIAFDDIGRFYFASNRETRINGDINIWEGFGLDSVPTIHALPSPVNTIKWESQPSVTREGNDLYFSSNSQSPTGSMEMLTDLYVARRNAGGIWSTPQRLGPEINMGNSNGTPCISPDGRFLFFSSKEKKGIDIKRKIYLSQRTGPKETDWSKAVLLPFPINSDKDDSYPMIAPNGKTIYFSSNRDGGSGMDIYEAELPLKIQALIAESFIRK